MKSISVSDSSPQSSWGQIIALEKRFAPMVDRLERSAEANADSYRRKVVVAGLLGYAVLGGTLLFFIGLCVLMIVLMVVAGRGFAAEARGLLFFGLISIALLRALWVERLEPEGVAVTRTDAPGLYAALDRIRRSTNGPAVHDVRIMDDMNAAITQDFRFFIFDTRNTLYIGLPLLLALTAHEVEAVIAHESGHFVGMHGRSAGFAYRVRRRWSQAAAQFPSGIVAGVMRRFFKWYGPWFASYSFVLARRQEYEADSVAASIAGNRTAADALLRVALQTERFRQTWATIWHQSLVGDSPPSSPYRLIAAAFHGDRDQDEATLRRALASGPTLDDTHPTLPQRLGALGESARIPPPINRCASEDLLTDAGERFITHFDAKWHEWCDDAWAEEYRERQVACAEREAIDEEIASGERGRDKLYRHAWLTEMIDGPAAGATAYVTVLKHHPDANDARFRCGQALLQSGDEAGVALLAEAGAHEATFLPHVYRHIIDFFVAHGRNEEAGRYISLLADAEERASRASAEAGTLNESSALRPLDPATRETLSSLSAPVIGVKTLHAAFRDLEHSTTPQIVFLFEAEPGVTGRETLDGLIEALLPAGDLLGIERSKNRRWLEKRIEALPLSHIR